ncbi:MAG: ATP-binding protein [Spirochaetales bacterium]|nr:ATP-binding protein [Spirochaetales bacterium]
MKQPLIETRNVAVANKAIAQTIKKNGFLAIVADVGSGKTTLHNRLVDYWQHDERRRFVVVSLKGFTKTASRISQIMKLLIEACDPTAYVPGSVERQYHALAQALRQAESTRRKVILVIDEAQDLNLQTFRDLKKIHEIAGADSDHLFSIILFGKTHRTWERIFNQPELGHRIDHLGLHPLTEDDIVLIAQKRFGLVFSGPGLKGRFASAILYRTPLGIQHLCNLLRVEFEDAVDKQGNFQLKGEHIAALPRLDLRYRLRKSNYTQRDVLITAKRMYPDMKGINAQRVSETLSGKLEGSSLSEAITNASETLLGGLAPRQEFEQTGAAIN